LKGVALLANITLGWKRLSETDTPAYWAHAFTEKKVLVNMAPGNIFTIHFLRNLQIGQICKSVKLH